MIDRFLIALCHHHFRSERQFVFHEIVLADIGLGFSSYSMMKRN